MVGQWPCQYLLGGDPAYCSVDENGRCNHPECDPVNDDRVAPQQNVEAGEQQATPQVPPLLSPEPHLGPREPMHGDAFVEFVDE